MHQGNVEYSRRNRAVSYGSPGYYAIVCPGVVWQWDEVLSLFPIGVPVQSDENGNPLYLVEPAESEEFNLEEIAVYPLDICRLDYEQKRSLMAVFSGFYGVPIQRPQQLSWIQLTLDLIEQVYFYGD